MIYGIEQTTDNRFPETRITQFHSRRRAEAIAWASEPLGYAWPGSANHDLPGPQQNFHSRIRSIYETPAGWRKPSRSELAARSRARRGPVRENDLIAEEIRQVGKRIVAETEEVLGAGAR